MTRINVLSNGPSHFRIAAFAHWDGILGFGLVKTSTACDFTREVQDHQKL